MGPPENDLQPTKLEKVAFELTGAPPGSHVNAEFCFHMTDWAEDLKGLAKLFESPSTATDQEWEEVVLQFLIHASGHIAAAAKLAAIDPVPFVLSIEKIAPTAVGESAEPAA